MERRWSWIRIRVGVSPLVILHFKSRDRARAVYFHGTMHTRHEASKKRSRIGRGSWKEEGSGRARHRRPTLDAKQGGVHPIFPRLSSPPHSGDCSNSSNIEALCADFFASCAVLKHGNARPFLVSSESNMGVLALKIFNTK